MFVSLSVCIHFSTIVCLSLSKSVEQTLAWRSGAWGKAPCSRWASWGQRSAALGTWGLIRDNLPELGSNLVTTLSSLQVHNFSHVLLFLLSRELIEDVWRCGQGQEEGHAGVRAIEEREGGWASWFVNDPGPDLRVVLSPLVTSARCGRHRAGL